MSDIPAHAGADAAVRDVLRPVRAPASARSTSAAVRTRLIREGLDFLVVVGGAKPRMVGVASRASLEPRDCCRITGGRCAVTAHLDPAAGFCHPGEALAEVLEAEQEIVDETPRGTPRTLPLIVVDHDLAPLGYLPFGWWAEDRARDLPQPTAA